MQINRDELFKLYMEWVDRVSEDCDWVTSFDAQDIVHSIANILENNPQLISDSKEKKEA